MFTNNESERSGRHLLRQNGIRVRALRESLSARGERELSLGEAKGEHRCPSDLVGFCHQFSVVEAQPKMTSKD